MSVFLPSKASKKYSVSGESDLFGNLVRTRNLEFTKKGYLSLARKPFAFYTELQDGDFQTPIFIASDDSTYYVGTSDHFFRSDLTGSFSFVEETGGTPPSLSFNSDYAFFTEDIHVSGTTSVCSFDLSGGTWTSRITGLSSSYPHPLCVSEHQQYLAVGNGNSVQLYDASYSLITTCTVPAAQIVTWIRWKGNILYFGTRNIFGGEARMYLWNGSGTGANAGYGVGCEWAMSGCLYEDTIAVAAISGQLLRFSGNGFTPLRTDDGREVAFPVYYTGFPWGSSASTSNLMSPVASRGMVAKGRRIFIFADAQIQVPPYLLTNFPSGLWQFDPAVGLYHKAGVDHKRANIVQPTSVTSDVLLLPSAQVFETGDPVYVHTVSGLTGDISQSKIYYAIKVDSTNLKLAITPAQALAGANITITGTPGASDILIFQVYQSVGATKVSRSGPVHLVTRLALHPFHGSEVIYGSEVDNNTGTTIASVMALGMGKNVGSLVTPKIQAENVTDIFKKLIAKFPPLNIPSRKILLKYRTEERWGVPGRMNTFGGNATWINSTSFTINPKLYDAYAMEVGDEVEFYYRACGGYTAHITAITVNSATDWTITIDETMPDVTASDVSEFYFENWTKYKTISTADDAKAAAIGLKNAAITENAKWIQLKVELRGYCDVFDSVDLEEVMLLTGADQKYA